MENEKQLMEYIHSLANETHSSFLIYGSIYNIHYFQGKSDIDVMFFTDKPYLTYIQLTQMMDFFEVSRHDYSFGCIQDGGSAYKINFVYKGIDSSIMIVGKRHEGIFRRKIEDEHRVSSIFGLFLYVIKFLHYYLHLIPTSFYKGIKKFLYQNKWFNRTDYSYTIVRYPNPKKDVPVNRILYQNDDLF